MNVSTNERPLNYLKMGVTLDKMKYLEIESPN